MKPALTVQTLDFSHERLADRLAASRKGRVALHLLCMFYRPVRLRWHLQGIAREMSHAVPLTSSLWQPSPARRRWLVSEAFE